MVHLKNTISVKDNIVEVKELKNITPAHLLNIFTLIEKSKNLPHKLNVLIDARDSSFLFNIKDSKRIANARLKALPNFEMTKEAILVSTPFETAIGYLISLTTRRHNYHLKVFSTRKAAIEWLKKDNQ